MEQVIVWLGVALAVIFCVFLFLCLVGMALMPVISFFDFIVRLYQAIRKHFEGTWPR